ncbi:MAG: DUF3048 domain-containing protein [Clostridia bacterium]|nr:DUF3048 domain-containing protein [Clostridia bacterium]
MNRRVWLVLAAMVVVLCAAVAIRLSIGTASIGGREHALSDDSSADTGSLGRDEADSVRSGPLTWIDPLDGRTRASFDSPTYFAAAVENSPAARPQRGLADARVVYEMLAEGGITRFVAFYSACDGGPIGPIRSARPYLVEVAQEHGAMFVHCGGSAEALAMIARLKYPAINEMRNGVAFFRDPSRRMPHNLFAKPKALAEQARKLGIRTDFAESGFEFAKAPVRMKDHASKATIKYPAGYLVRWEYDPSSNRCLRFMGGQPHTDPDSQAQISAANVIIQYAVTKIIDKEGRVSIARQGSGDALMLIGGRIVRGSWEREASDPTRYLGPDGACVKLNPGATWIQVVPVGTDVQIVEG